MPETSSARRLTLAIDRKGTVPVVQCSGRLVAGETDRFYSEVKQLVPEYKRVVLDFADLTHMDSMGLGTLVRLYVHAKSSGSVLDLVNVGKSVRQLLGITHMMAVFQVIGENNIRMG